jgi:hypothetical protein
VGAQSGHLPQPKYPARLQDGELKPVRQLADLDLPQFRDNLLGLETLPSHPLVLLVRVKTHTSSRATFKGLLHLRTLLDDATIPDWPGLPLSSPFKPEPFMMPLTDFPVTFQQDKRRLPPRFSSGVLMMRRAGSLVRPCRLLRPVNKLIWAPFTHFA